MTRGIRDRERGCYVLTGPTQTGGVWPRGMQMSAGATAASRSRTHSSIVTLQDALAGGAGSAMDATAAPATRSRAMVLVIEDHLRLSPV
jgi:hypothetical protein